MSFIVLRTPFEYILLFDGITLLSKPGIVQLFLKSQIRHSFGSVGLMVLLTSTQLCYKKLTLRSSTQTAQKRIDREPPPVS